MVLAVEPPSPHGHPVNTDTLLGLLGRFLLERTRSPR